VEIEQLSAWLRKMPDYLVASLYKGLGGQPQRVANYERMIQLSVRALAKGTRLAAALRQLQERDRKAMAALLQSGGVAHADEFHRELVLSYGSHEREWKRTMTVLAGKGFVMASPEQDGVYFYILPQPLIDSLLEALGDELGLPIFQTDDMRIVDASPFCPPLEFSITSLATYIDQNSPRLTQRQEIYRHDEETMDVFFSQIWEPGSELFKFHLDFLMMHGMVELRGEYLSLNRDVMEEWLQLEPEDQRDLIFRSMEQRFHLAEWVLWAIDGAGDGWVAERPLVALYRRWLRGEDWRDRFGRGVYVNVRTGERESYSFATLVRCGILEMGQWGQEKFYRLSARGQNLLHPVKKDEFADFYLTPAFEIMAPAGLSPIVLFRIGELAELIRCDRANTYKITEPCVDRALERGWRRDDVLQFLRDNSQMGLPDNVESTLKGWIGNRGCVEFHDLMLVTVHRSQIRRFEGNRKLKQVVLHRFAPGMYGVDRNRHEELAMVFKDCGFEPANEVRCYPGDPEQVEARQTLHRLVTEARDATMDPVERGQAVIQPENLKLVPGIDVVTYGDGEGAADEEIPIVTMKEAKSLIDRALAEDFDVHMVYVAKTGQRLTCRVQPERIAFKADIPVLVGLDLDEDEHRTFLLDRVERLRVVEA